MNLLKTEVLYSREKEDYSEIIFSDFKTFNFFNVNEHLAVPFIDLVMDGSFVGHLCFFCLHWIH